MEARASVGVLANVIVGLSEARMYGTCIPKAKMAGKRIFDYVCLLDKDL